MSLDWSYCAVGICGVAAGVAFYFWTQLKTPPPPPRKPRTPPPLRGFSPEELKKFNGTKGNPVYLSLKNIVYDVAPEFYGPGAPYHKFAAADSTIPLGTSEISDEKVNQDWSGLSPGDMDTANGWESKYQSKYDVVGWFVPTYAGGAEAAAKAEQAARALAPGR
eukprot:NODE_3711_length_639_cov_183.018644_g2669_i0.p2 GENE.NODE_3711_length_639_cov_183.018644_g2669_i0~~NODE_3711_length_639_cov_183.018644_g2669_i0.p2  ORF type:complete len:164 (+),score=44.23 NODE_3711_length_639_cov_183.018644_g2669_i0:77-568(+)